MRRPERLECSAAEMLGARRRDNQRSSATSDAPTRIRIRRGSLFQTTPNAYDRCFRKSSATRRWRVVPGALAREPGDSVVHDSVAMTPFGTGGHKRSVYSAKAKSTSVRIDSQSRRTHGADDWSVIPSRCGVVDASPNRWSFRDSSHLDQEHWGWPPAPVDWAGKPE